MGIKAKIAGAALAASITVATAVVSFYEGLETDAYYDPIGIVTVCYGHTATAAMGQQLTPQECESLLRDDLSAAFSAVDRHVNVYLTVERRAALASFVFNVGEGAFQRSTLLTKLNAGDTAGACAQLDRWIYAGGKVLPGLVTRRKTERELCELGLE
jgi:lysozyme